jgi:hypothetical protein
MHFPIDRPIIMTKVNLGDMGRQELRNASKILFGNPCKEKKPLGDHAEMGG